MNPYHKNFAEDLLIERWHLAIFPRGMLFEKKEDLVPHKHQEQTLTVSMTAWPFITSRAREAATLLIIFGVINLLNRFFPAFPVKLKIPGVFHSGMGKLMDKASFPAVFGLGLLVGICQFPCMGGPYLMVIGLLRDQVTYFSGFNYLLLYNLILILPLVAVLFISADKLLVDKVQIWKRDNIEGVRLWAGIAMIIIGILIFFI